jgi:hypothetical protein
MNWSNRLPSDIGSVLLKNATKVRVEFFRWQGELSASFKISGSIIPEENDAGEMIEQADLRPMFELLERFQKQQTEGGAEC